MNYPRINKNGSPGSSLVVYDASVNLNITPLSTATITLPEGSKVTSQTYIEMFTPNGSAGIFRSRTPRTGIGGQLTTVELEHAIAEIGDFLINDAIEQEMTLNAAAKKIFSFYKGNRWKLGSTARGSDKVILDTDHESCLDALLAVLEQEPTLMLSFSFSSYPWTVSIKEREKTVSAEGRLARNVKSATITADDTDLCTRVYMEALPGKNGNKYGKVDADTQSKYGIIERVISSTNYTPEQAKKVAEQYLAKHKEPKYSIQINGIDLAKYTGETLDKLEIGKLYRLALPAFGTTVEETITQLSWSSVYKNPESVTVSLADEEDAAVIALASQTKSAGKSAAKASKALDDSNAYWETRVSKVVDDKGNIKSASICLAINEGGSSATINAEKINLLGDVIAKTITAEYIKSKIATISLLSTKSISLTGNLTMTGAAQIGSHVYAKGYHIGTADSSKNLGYALAGGKVEQITGTNDYRIIGYDFFGNSVSFSGTFSRAVSSWLVGGGSGKVNITALPQNQMKSVNISVSGNTSITANGTYTYKALYENSSGDDVETGASRSVTVSVKPLKTQIALSRTKKSSEPSADGTLSAITANSWYLLTITAAGTEKTYKLNVNVS